MVYNYKGEFSLVQRGILSQLYASQGCFVSQKQIATKIGCS